MRMNRTKFTWQEGLFTGAVLLLLPAEAAAHLVTTGMGPVYDGIGHLLLTPEDLVPVLALALYAGLRGSTAGRRTMFLLPLAWLAGGIAGLSVEINFPLPFPTISFMLLGLLAATDLRLPASVVPTLAVGVGVFHGFFNGSALRDGGGLLGLVGIAIMIFVLAALASALVVAVEKTWARIAVRVAGSWIFASGLLMLGWLIRRTE